MTNEMSAADEYRAAMKSREEVIVDVHLPSGQIFKFAEFPSVHKNAFGLGRLPQYASNGAVESWVKQGIVEAGDISDDEAVAVNEGMRLRDLILDHSRVPKLVVGEAGPGELSTQELSNDDAAYLFEIAQAGGDEGLRLRMFPGRPQSNTLASSNRKDRRAAAKQSA